MRIVNYELQSKIEKEIGPLVAAIGFFDGLHRGHQQLLDEAVTQANKKHMQSALITFSPSPASVLAKKPEQLLTTVNERSSKAKSLGIDVFIVLKFNKKLSQLEPRLFYEKVLKTLNVKHLVCGEDFKFGFRGSGNVETLKTFKDLDLSVISDYKYNNLRISSTRIKENLSKGKVEKANELLGHEYELNGYVMHGRRKGRTIGFPTLNLLIKENKIIPKDGVYIGISIIKEKAYVSTINIGHNPTINQVEDKSVESYVHDYHQDTYGQKVTFKILKRIRDEKNFDSVDLLIEQMNKDIEITKTYFDIERRRFFDIEAI